MIISFFGYCIFLRSTKINAGPPKVSSLVDRMSTNVLSAISKTAATLKAYVIGRSAKYRLSCVIF